MTSPYAGLDMRKTEDAGKAKDIVEGILKEAIDLVHDLSPEFMSAVNPLVAVLIAKSIERELLGSLIGTPVLNSMFDKQMEATIAAAYGYLAAKQGWFEEESNEPVEEKQTS